VERLARDAGLSMPERDPQAEVRLEANQRLFNVLEAAQDCFALALRSADGARARAYLERRGLGEEAWERFGLGWSPAGSTWLKDRLTQAGHKLADILEAGLARQPDDGRAPYDFYRGRVMFAVTDTRGRTVSFGARTLDPDGTPKYLNGPETPVFNKSRNLYRYANARPMCRDRQLLVAEGYVDVIALEKAGWPAVAPLGTALTEDQLQLAWKAHRRPVICLDGDTAGLRAAGRALERALPLVSAERSVAFAILPQGQDPDDLIRAKGRAGMQEVLEAALPLGEFLVRTEAEREPLATAEARAALRKRLRQQVARVADPDLQAELKVEVGERVRALLGRDGPQPGGYPGQQPGTGWSPPGGGRGPRGRRGGAGELSPDAPATPELKRMATGQGGRPARALIDLVTAPARLPQLLDSGWEALAALTLEESGLDTLRQVMLSRYAAGETIEFRALRHHLATRDDTAALAVLQTAESSPFNPFVRAGQSPDDSARAWLAALEKTEGQRALAAEAAEGLSALADGDPAGLERLARLVAERRALKTSEQPSAAGLLPDRADP
jgi:DNA primase